MIPSFLLLFCASCILLPSAEASILSWLYDNVWSRALSYATTAPPPSINGQGVKTSPSFRTPGQNNRPNIPPSQNSWVNGPTNNLNVNIRTGNYYIVTIRNGCNDGQGTDNIVIRGVEIMPTSVILAEFNPQCNGDVVREVYVNGDDLLVGGVEQNLCVYGHIDFFDRLIVIQDGNCQLKKYDGNTGTGDTMDTVTCEKVKYLLKNIQYEKKNPGLPGIGISQSSQQLKQLVFQLNLGAKQTPESNPNIPVNIQGQQGLNNNVNNIAGSEGPGNAWPWSTGSFRLTDSPTTSSGPSDFLGMRTFGNTQISGQVSAGDYVAPGSGISNIHGQHDVANNVNGGSIQGSQSTWGSNSGSFRDQGTSSTTSSGFNGVNSFNGKVKIVGSITSGDYWMSGDTFPKSRYSVGAPLLFSIGENIVSGALQTTIMSYVFNVRVIMYKGSKGGCEEEVMIVSKDKLLKKTLYTKCFTNGKMREVRNEDQLVLIGSPEELFFVFSTNKRDIFYLQDGKWRKGGFNVDVVNDQNLSPAEITQVRERIKRWLDFFDKSNKEIERIKGLIETEKNNSKKQKNAIRNLIEEEKGRHKKAKQQIEHLRNAEYNRYTLELKEINKKERRDGWSFEIEDLENQLEASHSAKDEELEQMEDQEDNDYDRKCDAYDTQIDAEDRRCDKEVDRLDALIDEEEKRAKLQARQNILQGW